MKTIVIKRDEICDLIKTVVDEWTEAIKEGYNQGFEVVVDGATVYREKTSHDTGRDYILSEIKRSWPTVAIAGKTDDELMKEWAEVGGADGWKDIPGSILEYLEYQFRWGDDEHVDALLAEVLREMGHPFVYTVSYTSMQFGDLVPECYETEAEANTAAEEVAESIATMFFIKDSDGNVIIPAHEVPYYDTDFDKQVLEIAGATSETDGQLSWGELVKCIRRNAILITRGISR